ncbi:TlpA family protein disulfide reductase [Pseudomonas luteola]|uniref:TlpA family protein disulfide reductase n=1 Tax=Pseudomonas luteola TaxID=47886 RepID=UPI0012395FA2|nr:MULTISPECIES: TlpA disulfide reductase family protein [Pseudomonas]MBA1247084.1 TlpA family protein disulfide reductase [Pseudomonas zeshuii]QEU28290.1 TlpA family protein disulfide reductase [Pseudomonas luteola]
MITKALRGGLLVVSFLLAACTPDYGNDQYGHKIDNAQLDGRWLVINYWAEWCGPCHKEIPQLNALAKANAEIKVLGVNYDHQQDDALRKSVETMGIQYAVFQKDPAKHFDLPVSNVLPATYLVDPQGRFREKLVGEQTAAVIQARIAALEKQSP